MKSCVRLYTPGARPAKVLPLIRNQSGSHAQSYVGDGIVDLRPEECSVEAEMSKSKIRSGFRPGKPLRSELRVGLGERVAQTKAAIQLIQRGPAKRLVG